MDIRICVRRAPERWFLSKKAWKLPKAPAETIRRLRNAYSITATLLTQSVAGNEDLKASRVQKGAGVTIGAVSLM